MRSAVDRTLEVDVTPVRTVLAVVLTMAVRTAPLAAKAQKPGRVSPVGVLAARTHADSAPLLDALLRGLRDLGWIEGKNIAIEYGTTEASAPRRSQADASRPIRGRISVSAAWRSCGKSISIQGSPAVGHIVNAWFPRSASSATS
jgi:hypothetical protein